MDTNVCFKGKSDEPLKKITVRIQGFLKVLSPLNSDFEQRVSVSNNLHLRWFCITLLDNLP